MCVLVLGILCMSPVSCRVFVFFLFRPPTPGCALRLRGRVYERSGLEDRRGPGRDDRA